MSFATSQSRRTENRIDAGAAHKTEKDSFSPAGCHLCSLNQVVVVTADPLTVFSRRELQRQGNINKGGGGDKVTTSAPSVNCQY